MAKSFRILLIIVFLSSSLPAYLYAQEQNIAESFGLYSKGIEYYHNGKLYEAQQTLEQAVKLDPRNDEAQGYLDLVKAEINMRKEGRLNSYQEIKPIRKETDPGNREQYAETREYRQYESKPEPEIQPSEEPANNKEYAEEKEKPDASNVNNNGKISGEIRASIGITPEDFIWKDANGDNIGVPFEKNWRYLFGQDRQNTYDKKIYDSLKINLDTRNPTGFNLYGQIVIDPWTFVGTKDVRINSIAGGDYADIKLKYWSGTRSTINEIYRSNKYLENLVRNFLFGDLLSKQF